jgi:hypothetical protein
MGLNFVRRKLRPKVLEIQRSCLKTNLIPSKTKKSFTMKTKGLFKNQELGNTCLTNLEQVYEWNLGV